MSIRRHVRLLGVVLAALAGTSLVVIGFGLTPLNGSALGSMLGLGPKSDYSLTPSSSSVPVSQGSTGTVSIMITSLNHFSGDVSMTAITTTMTNSPTVTISQSMVNVASGATQPVSISISTTTSTTVGSYTLTVEGKSSALSHSTTVSVEVTPPPSPPTPDFYISANPTYLTTTQGGQTGSNLTMSSILDYAGVISLSATIFPSGMNSPTISLTRRSVLLTGGGLNSSIAMIDAFNATAGSYTIVIIGTSGSLQHELGIPLTITAFTGHEVLLLEVYSFPSQTNSSLWIRNVGTTTSTLIAYYVTDSSNDQYALTSWAGPTISPNQVGNAAVKIGAACPGCTLTGSAFTFTAGNSYTIIVVTRYGYRATFTVSA